MRALVIGMSMLAVGCGPAPSTWFAAAAPAADAARAGDTAGKGHLGAVSATASSRPVPRAQRVPAPDVDFVGDQGRTMTLKQFEGRVVLLNLWATWCAPCVREMPSLDQLAGDEPTLAVVPVSMDLHALNAVQFLERHGLSNLTSYHDPSGQLMRRFGAHGLPASFVIDREGRIAAVVRGAVDWTSNSMRELLAGI